MKKPLEQHKFVYHSPMLHAVAVLTVFKKSSRIKWDIDLETYKRFTNDGTGLWDQMFDDFEMEIQQSYPLSHYVNEEWACGAKHRFPPLIYL